MNDLIEFESDSECDQGEEDDDDSPIELARKKARLSPLHLHCVAPLSFLSEAVEQKEGSFNVTNIGCPFGKNKEAYARKCYEDIVQEIYDRRKRFRKETKPIKAAVLFVVGGSSGVGKSTFLAYFIVRTRNPVQIFQPVEVCYLSLIHVE